MSKLLKIFALAPLAGLGLFAGSHALADEPLSYHLETALEDGYYGYAARTPENYRFVMVKEGEPILYYPKNSGRTSCPPNSGSSTFFFSLGNNGTLLRVKQGSAYSRAGLFQKNMATRKGIEAAAGKVRLDQHYPCRGQVIRD